MLNARLISAHRVIVFMLAAGLMLQPIAPVFASFEPVYAQNNMVVSPEPNAAQAGLAILEQGGNAFDAAVAIGFALAVTYPSAGNIGGGGFMVGHTAEGERFMIDFREMAPGKATPTMYQDYQGNLIEGLSTRTLLAVGVPGTTHGLLTVLEDYGNLSRDAVLEPAVKLAEEGFSVSYSLNRALAGRTERLGRFDSTRKVFYPNGEAIAFGSTFRQPDLAATLTRIQEQGIPGFYEGKTADLLADYMAENDGIITREDLKNYHSKYRDPVVFSYNDYELITPALPSSGGITLGQILMLLEPFPLQQMGYHSAEYIATVVEAQRLAFADRNYYLGDMDFVDVPIDTLLSQEYLDDRRRMMPRLRAGNSEEIGRGMIESEETTHYCVVDSEGNVAAVTYTLNGSYGMGAVVEGAGFLLNNEMDDFSAKPGEPNMFGLVQAEANAIAPGKRMLSAMTPTIVLKDGEFAFTTGTPGGPTIITTNMQVILNVIEFGMNIREAIDAPRFHHQHLPDVISREPRAFSPDTEAKLIEMGYTMRDRGPYGFSCGIQMLPTGVLAGYADGRGEGLAIGN